MPPEGGGRPRGRPVVESPAVSDLRRALLITWIVCSVVIAGVLVTSRVMTPYAASRWLPVCESQANHGQPCSFCGMTTAFMAMARGRFGEASAANRGALPLWLSMLVNEVLLGAVLANHAIQRRRKCSS